MMENSEDLAAERMSSGNVVITNETSLQEINMDPLPHENMVIQGAEQGGTTDARRKRRLIAAFVVAFLALIGFIIGISAAVSKNRATALAASTDGSSTSTTSSGEASSGNDLLINENEPAKSFEDNEEDDDFLDDNQDEEHSAEADARKDAILEQLFTISGEQKVKEDGSPQNAAAKWIIQDDSMQLDADSPRLGQRYVMTVLYYSLGGPSWYNSTGFLSASNECMWHGVACRSGRVHKIELANNTMDGIIPNETGILENLDFLNLGGNFIDGAIPESLYNLTALTYLDLSTNFLTGTIPSSIKYLEKLGELRRMS